MDDALPRLFGDRAGQIVDQRFSLLDPLVWAGYRIPHLPYDRLPPLADYDAAAHLKKRAFAQLDPFSDILRSKAPRHVVWGFLRIFKGEYVVLCITISIRVTVRVRRLSCRRVRSEGMGISRASISRSGTSRLSG